MATEYTPNYNLDLYASEDKPNLRDQYNAAMGKIDTQMKKNADGVTNANANVGTLQTQMSTANANIETLQTTVAQHTTQIGTASDNASEALATANKNKSDIEGIDSLIEGQRQQIENLISTTEQQQIQITGKAPANHASPNATYGIGSATNYGHTKVLDTGAAAHTDGNAASTYAIQKIIDYFDYGQPVQLASGNFTKSDVFTIDGESFEVTPVTNLPSGTYTWAIYSQLNKDKTAGKIYGRVTFNPDGTYATTAGKIVGVKVPGLNISTSSPRRINYTGFCEEHIEGSQYGAILVTTIFIINGNVYLCMGDVTATLTFSRSYHLQTPYYFSDFEW